MNNIDSYWYQIEPTKCFRHLDFPLKIDTTQFPGNIINSEKKYWEAIPIKLDNETADILNDLDIKIGGVRLFLMPRLTNLTPHSDYEILNRDVAALNFVWGGDTSIMSWYKLKPGMLPTKKPDIKGTLVNYYDKPNLDIIAATRISACCLVNVGAIHTVDNSSNQDRTCLSIRLADKMESLLTWDEAEYKFRKYITDNPTYMGPFKT
jgi:hypothetical protein